MKSMKIVYIREKHLRPILQDIPVEVVLDYSVLYTLHRNVQKIRVRSVRVVYVNFSAFCPIQATKLIGKVSRSRIEILIRPCVVWEKVADWLVGQFLFKKVHLVKEEDD